MNIMLRGATQEQAGGAPLFAFRSRHGLLCGQGEAAALPPGPAETLAARAEAFFRAAGPEAVLAGALPFDRAAADHLIQPRRLLPALPPAPEEDAPPPGQDWRLRHEPDAAGYAAAVRRALDIMAGEAGPDRLDKIVLARSLLAHSATPIDTARLLHRLSADPAVTAFLVPLPPQEGRPRLLMGATPELLVSKTGEAVVSHPLAGSARRQADASADRAAAEGLARSEKDQREHAIVVEYILDTLAPFCRDLATPEGTTLTSTRSMWHLGTRIEGVAKEPGLSVLALAAALHPTPAVCGLPRARAATLIGEIEPASRGFYAGAVGWGDGRGDGAWHVAIRCAEISGHTARLYAGAGIVPGSDPWQEAAETGAKYGAMLAALGIDPRGVDAPAP
ncbi:isochorismate synthase [Roseomonas sp. GC11]|uniref:isochorismate synthase n=1 Tax=Roseomonas sp. GC11 TaxID=2950546 RepID=UPI00210967C1|nr:isochorismate synthase [Roseomonas sp. GC11]MCQ4159259.1 isochorismate synthase [Roseomonas sp. GC11]